MQHFIRLSAAVHIGLSCCANKEKKQTATMLETILSSLYRGQKLSHMTAKRGSRTNSDKSDRATLWRHEIRSVASYRSFSWTAACAVCLLVE